MSTQNGIIFWFDWLLEKNIIKKAFLNFHPISSFIKIYIHKVTPPYDDDGDVKKRIMFGLLQILLVHNFYKLICHQTWKNNLNI